ncbi:MAG: hypothetical protein JSW54_01335 [Fidelibacterota bacterium]|nr:MAG: hypothetical protein JSW54_01335 [Candidatus Neomarinimicrobiota bacterium]
MNSSKIPRWYQCGIFSTPFWWTLLLVFSLQGQQYPHLSLQPRATTPAIPHSNLAEALTILALRVAFTPDLNVSTTGDGQFLMGPGTPLCDGFLVDPPPHDVPYFYAQLKAIANYFQQVTRGGITLSLSESLVFPEEGEDPIVLDNMAAYRPVADEDSSDDLLVDLYAESLLEAVTGGVNVWDYDLVVVFHAGLGQDFAYPTLDPTPLDIPSAYVDLDMIENALGSRGIPLSPDTLYDRPAIILPEGQNHIYYDIVEDIFPGADNHCDVQLGLTGTFALLMGYALGFPPLFDTEDGDPGVGVFGLMDLGSNNGQGVVPAPPTAWTRTYLNWEDAVELQGDVALSARHLPESQIGRVTLSNSEYLLIENRLNWIPGLPRVSMDTLRYRHGVPNEYGGLDLPPYFDYLVDSAGVTVDSATKVIIAVPNYDLGLPGSGLLIWHVDESRYVTDMQGINDDREARAVELKEADGAVDIGFPTTALIDDPVRGWGWDMWFAGNEAFFYANPDRDDPSDPVRLLTLDSDTHPSTRLNSGAESGIVISRIDSAGEVLHLRIEDEVDVTRLPEGSRLLGFNGQEYIYALRDSLWLGNKPIAGRYSNDNLVVSEHDPVTGPASDSFWIVEQGPAFSYIVRRFDGEGNLTVPELRDSLNHSTAYYDAGFLYIGLEENPPFPPPPDTTMIRYYQHYSFGSTVYSWGYIFDTTDTAVVIQTRAPRHPPPSDNQIYWHATDKLSLGDLDGDGLDEIIATSPSQVVWYPERMTAENGDRLALDGFPVAGDFKSPALVANLRDDFHPELITVESNDIVVYNHEGQRQLRMGLHTRPSELFLMHMDDDRIGLANGDRIHWFGLEPEEQNPQWVTPQGRHSRSRHSLNEGIVRAVLPKTLDKSRVYNYPNPVTDGRTTVRFFIGSVNKATVSIFTIDGLLVKRIELTNLIPNDYNEWIWEVGDNPSGLYYGVIEVEDSRKESALIKIAVVR